MAWCVVVCGGVRETEWGGLSGGKTDLSRQSLVWKYTPSASLYLLETLSLLAEPAVSRQGLIFTSGCEGLDMAVVMIHRLH